MNNSIPLYIKFLLKIAFASLFIMTCFRGLLFLQISYNWDNKPDYLSSELVSAFIMGLRFDIVVIGYMLLPPFLILGLTSFFTHNIQRLTKGIYIYLCTVNIIILFIFCADIPYFLHFFSRLSSSSLLWLNDYKYMLSMIVNEMSFILYFIVFSILTVVSFYFLSRERRRFLYNLSNHPYVNNHKALFFKIFSFLIVAAGLIIGLRGRVAEKSAIRIGTAYFSENQLLNKLALNPVFTFGHSLVKDWNGQKKIQLMNTEKANKLASSLLTLPETDTISKGILHKWKAGHNSEITENNVVFIIMESMGSFKLGKYNGPKGLTPELNGIISKSLFFDNIYTAGTHTFNGIYSTLFSFPALYKQQPLEDFIEIPHEGIANILKKNGYSTLYFSTHDPQFNNVSGFLKANGFGNIYSEFDYPNEWAKSTNGVPDHKMFEYSISKLNAIHQEGKHFFAAFMTSSDHKPFVIPDNINFKPNSDKIEHQIVEYADWSIGKFFEDASKQSWYENTTFVLIADHGLNMGHTYDMPLSHHHTPLIIFTPSSSPVSDTLHNLGGQIDAAPTLLGLLNIPYENKTMGINLLKYKRPYMYFCSDDKIGCLDNEHYLIMRQDNIESLYRYENLETKNFIDSFPLKVNGMKEYTFSMMQATQERMTPKAAY